MMVNREFIVAGINNLLKTNYGIDPQTVDIEAYVDSTLTYGENWNLIKEMINIHSIPYEFLMCKHCAKPRRADWEYCPKCGKSINGGKMKEVINTTGSKIKLLKKVAGNTDSFVYLDPPYYPVAKKEGGKVSLNNIYNGLLTPTDFLKLKERCDDLTRSGIPFIFNNSDCEFIRILFKNYPIVSVDEPHEMKKGTKGEKNYKSKCVIITNLEKKEDFMGKITEMNEIITK